MIALLASAALAAGPPELTGRVGGDVKSFFLASFPYDHLFQPPDPYGQATIDGRLKLSGAYGDVVRVELHHAATMTSAPDLGALIAENLGLPDLMGFDSGAIPGAASGVGQQAPEALDMSWEIDDSGKLQIPNTGGDGSQILRVFGRVDRARITLSVPGVDMTLGRQPVSLGNTTIFTPMDLVNPFTPTTIDSEYKPGVDAVRVDAYAGMSGNLTAVAAYAGDWSLDGTVMALYGGATVGVTDIVGLVAASHSEPVFGLGTVSGIGPVGVRADATLTLPEDEDPFVRAAVGADWRPTGTTTLSGEVYVQTIGGAEPSEYVEVISSARAARGEVWQMGRTYLGLVAVQEITPLVVANVSLITNVEDPSALLAPAVSWSVAENADLAVGMYAGLGRRPGEVDLLEFFGDQDAKVRSEFGLYPTVGFLQMKAYF